jgi:hypothetical protein
VEGNPNDHAKFHAEASLHAPRWPTSGELRFCRFGARSHKLGGATFDARANFSGPGPPILLLMAS